MYYYRSLALEVGVRQGAGMEDLYPFDHCKTIKKQHINNTTPFIQKFYKTITHSPLFSWKDMPLRISNLSRMFSI
jgi:hypothetical protein